MGGCTCSSTADSSKYDVSRQVLSEEVESFAQELQIPLETVEELHRIFVRTARNAKDFPIRKGKMRVEQLVRNADNNEWELVWLFKPVRFASYTEGRTLPDVKGVETIFSDGLLLSFKSLAVAIDVPHVDPFLRHAFRLSGHLYQDIFRFVDFLRLCSVICLQNASVQTRFAYYALDPDRFLKPCWLEYLRMGGEYKRVERSKLDDNIRSASLKHRRIASSPPGSNSYHTKGAGSLGMPSTVHPNKSKTRDGSNMSFDALARKLDDAYNNPTSTEEKVLREIDERRKSPRSQSRQSLADVAYEKRLDYLEQQRQNEEKKAREPADDSFDALAARLDNQYGYANLAESTEVKDLDRAENIAESFKDHLGALRLRDQQASPPPPPPAPPVLRNAKDFVTELRVCDVGSGSTGKLVAVDFFARPEPLMRTRLFVSMTARTSTSGLKRSAREPGWIASERVITALRNIRNGRNPHIIPMDKRPLPEEGDSSHMDLTRCDEQLRLMCFEEFESLVAALQDIIQPLRSLQEKLWRFTLGEDVWTKIAEESRGPVVFEVSHHHRLSLAANFDTGTFPKRLQTPTASVSQSKHNTVARPYLREGYLETMDMALPVRPTKLRRDIVVDAVDEDVLDLMEDEDSDGYLCLEDVNAAKKDDEFVSRASRRSSRSEKGSRKGQARTEVVEFSDEKAAASARDRPIVRVAAPTALQTNGESEEAKAEREERRKEALRLAKVHLKKKSDQQSDPGIMRIIVAKKKEEDEELVAKAKLIQRAFRQYRHRRTNDRRKGREISEFDLAKSKVDRDAKRKSRRSGGGSQKHHKGAGRKVGRSERGAEKKDLTEEELVVEKAKLIQRAFRQYRHRRAKKRRKGQNNDDKKNRSSESCKPSNDEGLRDDGDGGGDGGNGGNPGARKNAQGRRGGEKRNDPRRSEQQDRRKHRNHRDDGRGRRHADAASQEGSTSGVDEPHYGDTATGEALKLKLHHSAEALKQLPTRGNDGGRLANHLMPPEDPVANRRPPGFSPIHPDGDGGTEVKLQTPTVVHRVLNSRGDLSDDGDDSTLLALVDSPKDRIHALPGASPGGSFIAIAMLPPRNGEEKPVKNRDEMLPRVESRIHSRHGDLSDSDLQEFSVQKLPGEEKSVVLDVIRQDSDAVSQPDSVKQLLFGDEGFSVQSVGDGSQKTSVATAVGTKIPEQALKHIKRTLKAGEERSRVHNHWATLQRRIEISCNKLARSHGNSWSGNPKMRGIPLPPEPEEKTGMEPRPGRPHRSFRRKQQHTEVMCVSDIYDLLHDDAEQDAGSSLHSESATKVTAEAGSVQRVESPVSRGQPGTLGPESIFMTRSRRIEPLPPNISNTLARGQQHALVDMLRHGATNERIHERLSETVYPSYVAPTDVLRSLNAVVQRKTTMDVGSMARLRFQQLQHRK